MIPRTVDDWSLNIVSDLLTKGYYESEFFDFKGQLPHGNDERGKLRLRKACCAFANSQGGFLVFGIADDKSLPINDRLTGMDSSIDFPEHFGNYPQKCEPSVQWNFKNPPISLPNGNYLHVVHIVSSWNVPHCIEVNDGRMFLKRTNKGDELMSYNEIRMSFLQYYEKRLKLQLLKSELQIIADTAQVLVHPTIISRGDIVPREYNLTVLESVLSETYTVLAENSELINDLNRLRIVCREANIMLHAYFGVMMFPFTNRQHMVTEHNNRNRQSSVDISNLANSALKRLGALLAS